MKKQKTSILLFLLRPFCPHRWILISINRHIITDSKRIKTGEVTLIHLECEACKKTKVIPVNKTLIEN